MTDLTRLETHLAAIASALERIANALGQPGQAGVLSSAREISGSSAPFQGGGQHLARSGSDEDRAHFETWKHETLHMPEHEPTKGSAMTEAQIKHMVEQFLRWKLPADFNPDAGISFKAEFNEHTAWPMTHEPVGTNLFTYIQAEAMVRHMVADLPANPARSPGHTDLMVSPESPDAFLEDNPPPDDEGWIPWSGGKRPVGSKVHVDVRFRNGNERDGLAYRFDWTHHEEKPGADLVFYRPHKDAGQ